MRNASATKLERLASHLAKPYFPDCQKCPFKKPIRSIEHGPQGGDEINRIEKGKHYGWPVISYGKEYWGPVAVGEAIHKDGTEQPVKVYIPSYCPGSLNLLRRQSIS